MGLSHREASFRRRCSLSLIIALISATGIEAVRLFKARGSKAKIVFLTVHEDHNFVREALDVGAGIRGEVSHSVGSLRRDENGDEQRLFSSPRKLEMQ